MKSRVSVAMIALLLCSCISYGADWGDLTATFVFDGVAPKAKALVINKDEAVCGKHGLVDESLLVNSANNGIENVIVYLYVARGGKKPPVHESYKASEKAPVICDNHQCRFEPHVTAVRTTQTLVAGNKDTIGHNMNVATLKNPAQNILIPAGGQLKLNMTIEESLPTPISCNIHPWMKGYLVVKDHPYVGVSDKNGKLAIKNLPAGKWTFQIWQESAGFVTGGKQNGKPVKWEKGRVEIDVKSGANDLGEIKLPSSVFKMN